MKNNKGFTLVEVIISLMILSISLVVFISLFGNAVTMISDSKTITNETFALQEKMENKIINDKKGFVEGTLIKDYDVQIFTGDYQSDVPVAEIEETHSSGRKYITLVSDVDIVETKLPAVEYFEVGAFLDSDTFYNTEVFPWYEDNIVLGAKFQIEDDPVIFENRKRWYRSKENINNILYYNPVYRSEYDIVEEEKVEEPNSDFSVISEIKIPDPLENNKFYYFELRPYSLAGRVAHFINEQRILVLSKPSNNDWKEFIEGIYPKTSAGDTIKYGVVSGEEIYSEVMQNPDKATLDLEWSDNSDPEGALIGTEIPNIYLSSDFNVKVDFQIDSDAILEERNILGMGVSLGDGTNTGGIITFDVSNNKLIINAIDDGDYLGNDIMNIDLLTDSSFDNFVEEKDGEYVFKWYELFTLSITYLNDENKVQIYLSYEDGGNIISSDTIETPFSFHPSYVGLKAYSSSDYMIANPDERINEYERNYSTHFYNLDFQSDSIMEITDDYFVDDDKIVIEFDQDIKDNIKMNEDINGNGTIEDDEWYFYFEDDSVINAVTKSANNQITIFLDEGLSIYDKYIGKKLYIKLGGIETETSGYVDIVNANPYEIKLNIEYVFDENFENYDDDTEFNDEYISSTGWSIYQSGTVEFIDNGTNKYLKKISNNDPNGAYKAFNREIINESFIAEVKINRINSSGGNKDRISISKKGNGDNIEGYGVAITGSQLRIEKRSGAGSASK
ncbi:MAG: prepilin-type N-terminal cleavage/methylation domain-containing protein, partial [Bacillota bacterium]|nr:prepilin-type N-terminal cleavage/methylation domain-containing protein [Bacillota bacterium]